jgi:hypothetical protein
MVEGTGAEVSEEHPDPVPAANADEAALQARAIRQRVDQDLRALEARLPAPATLTAQVKTYGGAAAAGLATLGAGAIVFKRRSAAKAQEKEAQRQAEALARALPEAALRVRQEHVSSPYGRLGLFVALAALGVAVWTRFSGSSGSSGDGWG